MYVIGSIIKGVFSISAIIILIVATIWTIKSYGSISYELNRASSSETQSLISYNDTSPIKLPISTPTPGSKNIATPTIVAANAIVNKPKDTPTPTLDDSGKSPFLEIDGEYQITDVPLEKGGICAEDYYSYVSWSPDGRSLLTSRSNGKYVTDGSFTLGSTDMWRYSLDKHQWDLFIPNAGTGLWSPDGKKILYTSLNDVKGMTVFVVDSNGKNTEKLGNANWRYPISWFDADTVMFFSNDIKGWDIKPVSGKAISTEAIEALNRIQSTHSPIQRILSAPHKQQLAYIQDKKLFVEHYSGTFKLLSEKITNDQGGVSWSFNDRILSYVEYEENTNLYVISIYDTNSDIKKQIFESDRRIDQLNWFPDNQAILFQTYEGSGLFNIQVISADGSSHISLLKANPGSPKLSHDGRTIEYFKDCNLWLAEISAIDKSD